MNKLTFWLEHQQARANLRRLIRQKRRDTWKQFCQQLESQDYSKPQRRISRIKKGRAAKPTFTVTEGPNAATDIIWNLYSAVVPFQLQPHQ